MPYAMPSISNNQRENLSRSTSEDSAQHVGEASKLKWTSRTEFIVSLLGYSMGLSDIWRVPYVVYRNGGGAFLIPYIFFMLVCGIPLYFLEIMLSQFSGKGCWRVWDVCPLFRGFGLAYLVINWVASIYLMILKPWTIEYIVGSFQPVLPWSHCSNEWNTPGCIAINVNDYQTNVTNIMPIYHNDNVSMAVERSIERQSSVEEYWNYKVLNLSSGIDEIGTMNKMYLLYLVVCYFIVWVSLLKSVQTMGKMMYVTTILPVILTLAIWIRALSLTGSTDGMKYFITPDFSHLANTQVWIEAAFMAFFTLGPGWGGLAVYGSHNKFYDNCYRDSIISTVMTMLYGLFNGLVIFSVIGVMAHQSGIPIDKIITSGGISLGFVAYPLAATFFTYPRIWSVLFFIVLLLPGLDGQSILIEPILCIIEEKFPTSIGRRRLPLLTGLLIVTFIAGIPFISQAGVYMFQLIDWYTATWSVLLIAVLESILFSWIYGGDRLSRDFSLMMDRHLPAFVRVSCAYVTPVLLLFLVIVSVFKYEPPRYGSYEYTDHAIIIGWCFAMASIVPIILWMVYAVFKENGPILLRFRKLLSPNQHWAPADHTLHAIFKASETDFRWTARDLIHFNITGETRSGARLHEQVDMTCMTSSNINISNDKSFEY